MMVNGEQFDYALLAPDYDLPALLRHLALSAERVAIEINGELLSRQQYAEKKLAEKDQLEIIHYVGGG